MIRSRGWRLPALLTALFLLGALAPTAAVAQPPGGGRIVGQITENGAPLAGASVHVHDLSSTLRAIATTDAAGAYAAPDLPPGVYKVAVYTPDFRQQWAFGKLNFFDATVIPVFAGQDSVVNEAILPTGSLRITAVDRVTGAPATGFRAEAFGQGLGRGEYTETDTVTLTGLAAGEYQVAVYPGETHFEGRSTATVVVGETTAVRIELEPAAVITTTVVDAATGAPVENTCIAAVADLQVFGRYVHSCSGSDGVIRVGRLTTGSYRVYAKPDDDVHGAQWVGRSRGTGSRYLAAVVSATAGSATAAPTIRLDGAGTVTGAVTDAATGLPVANMCAYPYASATDAGPEPGPFCSDSQGRYTLDGLGPYRWPIEFIGDYTNAAYAWQWSGNRPNQLVARTVEVTAGGTATVDARLTPGARVTGRVLDATGAPVPGVVFAQNALTGDPATAYAIVDENGYYELSSLAGQFVRLRWEADYPSTQKVWYRNATSFHSATPVWVPPAGTSSNINLTIPTG